MRTNYVIAILRDLGKTAIMLENGDAGWSLRSSELNTEQAKALTLSRLGKVLALRDVCVELADDPNCRELDKEAFAQLMLHGNDRRSLEEGYLVCQELPDLRIISPVQESVNFLTQQYEEQAAASIYSALQEKKARS